MEEITVVERLEGSKTEANLRRALASESLANRRYLYFAQQAEVDGEPEVAALFRSVAEGETGHAFGLLDFLVDVDDPVTGAPLGDTEDNLRAAIAYERQEATELYPELARTARDEGFIEIAEWMESLARAEDGNANRLAEGLESRS